MRATFKKTNALQKAKLFRRRQRTESKNSTGDKGRNKRWVKMAYARVLSMYRLIHRGTRACTSVKGKEGRENKNSKRRQAMKEAGIPVIHIG